MQLHEPRVSGVLPREHVAHPRDHGSGPDAVESAPRRGTTAHRRWLWAAAIIGSLPVATLALGVGSMLAFDTWQLTGDAGWNQLGSVLGFIQVLVAVVGFVALLNVRTRTTGIATLVLSAIFNNWTMALLPGLLLGPL